MARNYENPKPRTFPSTIDSGILKELPSAINLHYLASWWQPVAYPPEEILKVNSSNSIRSCIRQDS